MKLRRINNGRKTNQNLDHKTIYQAGTNDDNVDAAAAAAAEERYPV